MAAALALGALAVVAFLANSTFGPSYVHGTAADLSGALEGARRILAGQHDVYATPYAPYVTAYPLSYPLTTAFLVLPLAWLPAHVAAMIFVGLTTTAAAYTLSRRRLDALLLFTSAPAVFAWCWAQWSPLFLIQGIVSWTVVFAIAKPQLGAAMFAYRPNWTGLALAVAAFAATLVWSPTWPLDWLRGSLHDYKTEVGEHLGALFAPGGFTLACRRLLEVARPTCAHVARPRDHPQPAPFLRSALPRPGAGDHPPTGDLGALHLGRRRPVGDRSSSHWGRRRPRAPPGGDLSRLLARARLRAQAGAARASGMSATALPRRALPRSPSRAYWHPLVVACLCMIGARGLGLILYLESNDPNGNVINASPAQGMLIALPYHGMALLTTAGVLLALWKLVPFARPVITVVGIVVALGTIMLGQVDLAMQWFIGQHFVPMVAGTYVGTSVLSSDVYEPLLYHPIYLATGLLLMFVPWLLVGRSLLHLRQPETVRPPGWGLIAGLLALAVLCRIPVTLAYGHQLDVMRPPELAFVDHWFFPSPTPAPSNEERAIAQLRAAIDPSGTSRWLDPQLPLVRDPSKARNRYLTAPATTEQPDILIFAVESLRGADVGYVPGNYPPGESPTPRLDQLAQRGVVFSHYIANGNPSPRGFFAINGGVWDHRESFIVSGSTGTEFDALPARLRRAGYFTLGLWGADPSFDNQFFWARKWYDRRRYPSSVGRFVILHPLADDLVMDDLIDEVSAHDRAHPTQPLFAYIASGGTHEPYTILGQTHLPDSTVRAVAAEHDPRRRYRMVLHNLDAQIGRVLDFLNTRPKTRPAIIIVVGDHSDVAGDTIPPEMRGLPNNAGEWTAALIAGPSAMVGPVPRVDTFPAATLISPQLCSTSRGITILPSRWARTCSPTFLWRSAARCRSAAKAIGSIATGGRCSSGGITPTSSSRDRRSLRLPSSGRGWAAPPLPPPTLARSGRT